LVEKITLGNSRDWRRERERERERERDSYQLPESLFLRRFLKNPKIHTSGNTHQLVVDLRNS